MLERFNVRLDGPHLPGNYFENIWFWLLHCIYNADKILTCERHSVGRETKTRNRKMTNTNDLATVMAAELNAAIDASIANNEIARVELSMSSIGTVVEFAKDRAANVDWASENDGSYDVWGFSDDMPEGEMSWRLNVRLTEAK